MPLAAILAVTSVAPINAGVTVVQHKAANKPAPIVKEAVEGKAVSNADPMKLRKEFDALGVTMAGMATFMGESSVFLKYRGQNDQVICGVGQIIGGFKIVSIQPGYTVFERDGGRIWLAVGDSAGRVENATPAPSPQSAPEEDPLFVPIRNKSANSRTKVLTKAYKETLDSDGLTQESDAPAFRSGSRPAQASMQDGRFMMPVRGFVTSPFGYRKAPTGGARKYHQGIDLQGGEGSPVVAAAGGTVVSVSYSWAKGNNVLVQHADGYETAYFHFSKVAVKTGQKVRQGDVLGFEGDTGIATGPHLHFEIHKNGVPVDPALYLKGLTSR